MAERRFQIPAGYVGVFCSFDAAEIRIAAELAELEREPQPSEAGESDEEEDDR